MVRVEKEKTYKLTDFYQRKSTTYQGAKTRYFGICIV